VPTALRQILKSGNIRNYIKYFKNLISQLKNRTYRGDNKEAEERLLDDFENRENTMLALLLRNRMLPLLVARVL
jgi:hypothetical protein